MVSFFNTLQSRCRLWKNEARAIVQEMPHVRTAWGGLKGLVLRVLQAVSLSIPVDVCAFFVTAVVFARSLSPAGNCAQACAWDSVAIMPGSPPQSVLVLADDVSSSPVFNTTPQSPYHMSSMLAWGGFKTGISSSAPCRGGPWDWSVLGGANWRSGGSLISGWEEPAFPYVPQDAARG